MDSLKMIGAHGKRREMDFYPTPPECTIALVRFLKAQWVMTDHDTVWEPASGQGDMVRALRSEGLVVTASDIQGGFDFLDRDFELDGRWVITNPPFSLAEAFIRRAAELGRPFAFLLKNQYWNSAKRRALFEEHTPSYVLPLTWRPDFTGKGSSMLDMCWNVWLGAGTATIYHPLPKPKGL